MKNLKVILSLLPVLALTCFIYFSTLGFSNLNTTKTTTFKNKIESIPVKKPSTTVMLWINLRDLGGNHCLGGSYEYCINGGHAIFESTEGFYAEVPCGETFTICVSSGNCWGSWTGTVSCNTDTFINVDMSPENKPCSCD